MTAGSLVLGLLNGLTIGLLAVGLVLVYKSNRFLNLAHAQMGTVAALLLSKWVLDWHWNWWVSFLLALVVGTGTGLLVERFLVGPLRARTRSPLRLLLMTVAVSQLLLALTYIPHLSPDPKFFGIYPQPFSSSVRVGGVVLSGMSILTAVLVPVLVVSLALFMRYSWTGRQIRAAANNVDASRLCGISVSRVSAITWGMAGALSTVSAVLQAPNQPGFNISSFGPYLLMVTLGAAAFGAFVSLPAALGGGMVLGLISQFVAAETSDSSKAELVVFVAILAIVLVRGRAIGRVFALAGAAVEERAPVRVPHPLRETALVRHHRSLLAGAALFMALVLPCMPYFDTEGHRFLLSLVLVYGVLGVALTMLVGWSGQVSLGHFAVVGLGAYVTGKLSAHHWSVLGMFLVVGLIGAAVMLAVGLPALRVRGLTLAVTTLGLAVISADWLFRQGWAGSSQPFLDVSPSYLGRGLGSTGSMLSVYYLCLVVLVGVMAAASALRRSSPGRLIVAVRDNERSASAFGVSPATVKLGILALSGFFAGLAGVLYGDAWRVASPSQFTADLSIAALAVPVIGGLGSVAGAAAGAAVLYMGTFFVGPLVAPLFGKVGHNLGFQLFLAGLGQAVVLLAYPSGIAGLAQDRWQAFLDRRGHRLDTGEVAAGPTLPLVTERVTARFGGVVALDGVDIEVRPGEIVGLIGPNGAGKTTLMNAISGLIPAGGGSVRIFGQEVADLPTDLRAGYGLARSFQDADLFAGLTVRQTVQVGLANRRKVGLLSAMVAAPWVRAGERETRARAAEIIERLGLTPWADTLTSELSTGTRRICDLAAQVAAEPRLLLLDEPTAGVAQREAESFGPLLRRIRDELDCSVLIVEHDMPLLMALCDRVYAMEAGHVIAEGTPEALRHDPAVIASYLGTEETAIRRSGVAREAGNGKAAANEKPAPRKRAAPRRKATAPAGPD